MKKLYRNKFWVYSSGLITNLEGKSIGGADNGRKRIGRAKERFFAYQAVCECHHPNWAPDCIIHHLDGDASNNNIANLYICKNHSEHRLFHEEQFRIVFKRSKDKQCWKKALQIAHNLPRTKKQLETAKKNIKIAMEKSRITNRKIKPEMEEQFLKDCKTMTKTAVAKKYNVTRALVYRTLGRLKNVSSIL